MVPFPRRLPHSISPLEEGGFEPLVPLTRKGTKATEPRAPLPGALVWERIESVADHWLPKPTILHFWRSQRSALRRPR